MEIPYSLPTSPKDDEICERFSVDISTLMFVDLAGKGHTPNHYDV